MKILKTLIFSALFLLAVLLASANVQRVDFVYRPSLPLPGWQAAGSVDLPLFVLVLGAMFLGLLLGASGAWAEQLRLRAGLRRRGREVKKLREEARAAREEIERGKRESRAAGSATGRTEATAASTDD